MSAGMISSSPRRGRRREGPSALAVSDGSDPGDGLRVGALRSSGSTIPSKTHTSSSCLTGGRRRRPSSISVSGGRGSSDSTRAPRRATLPHRRPAISGGPRLSPAGADRLAGPVGRLAGPVGRLAEPVGRADGAAGPLAEPVGRAPEPVGRLAELVGRADGPVGRLAEPVGRAERPGDPEVRLTAAPAARFGPPTARFGEPATRPTFARGRPPLAVPDEGFR